MFTLYPGFPFHLAVLETNFMNYFRRLGRHIGLSQISVNFLESWIQAYSLNAFIHFRGNLILHYVKKNNFRNRLGITIEKE